MQPQILNQPSKSQENIPSSHNFVQGTIPQEERISNVNPDVNLANSENKQQMEEEYIPAVYGDWKKLSNINQLTVQNISSSVNSPNGTNSEVRGQNVGVIFNRINHCAFQYKNWIYYFGGCEAKQKYLQEYGRTRVAIERERLKPKIPNESEIPVPQVMQVSLAETQRKESLWNSFHKYNVVTKQFSRHYLNISSNLNLFYNISSFGYFVLGNQLFIFGGINYETQIRRNAEMFSINLDSGHIKRYESKTSFMSTPPSRLNPLITAIQKTVLLLFGGEVFNQQTQTYSYLNDMYTFKIETKTWTKVEDNMQLKYPVLHRPTLINFGDNCIYILGGQREIVHNSGKDKQEYLWNTKMYRLKIITKTVSYRADCCIREVFNTNPIPETQAFIKIIKYNEKGLVAVTTDVHQPYQNAYFWYYDQYNAIWTEIKHHNHSNSIANSAILHNISCKPGEDFVVAPEKIYSSQNSGEIYELSFNNISLQSIIKETLSYKNRKLCCLCQEQKSLNYETRYQIPAEHYEQFCSTLEFPFSAIGLLVDNTVLAKAKTCNVYFNVGYLGRETTTTNQRQRQREKYKQSGKVKYLIVEDNGYPCCIWSPEMKQSQFIQIISNYSTNTCSEQQMANEDNKVLIQKCLKEIDEKQKVLQKEFTAFLKNQSKNSNNANNNQNVPQNYNAYNAYSSHSHANFKNEKDVEKQQHEYIQKRQRLQHKQKILEIQQKCKKFCNNLKLAGLKLGECVIYACKQKKDQQNQQYNPIDKQIRRFFFMRREKNILNGKQYYMCYAYVTENNIVADPKMQSMYKFVSKQFKKQLKIVTQRLKTMNNVVLITDLKNVSNFQDTNSANLSNSIPISQLRLKKKQNDVFYGENSIINYLESNNVHKMTQCCDISLKSYLSLLYLNSEQLNINLYLSVRQSPLEYINTQPFLAIIDKLNGKKFIEVSKSLDFADECPVVEVYWYPEYATNHDNIASRINNLGFLLNGILIYHKGRLITRYGISLGQLLDKIEFNPKYGSIFGFLDIKEQYGTNLYATDLFYSRTFEKYFARLNFVSEFMESKYKDKRTRSRDDHHTSGYQRISKRTKYE